jgi:hypothetical protein
LHRLGATLTPGPAVGCSLERQERGEEAGRLVAPTRLRADGPPDGASDRPEPSPVRTATLA